MTPPLEKWLAEVEKRHAGYAQDGLAANNDEMLLVKLLRKCMSQRNRWCTEELSHADADHGYSKIAIEQMNQELAQIISDTLGADNG
jgi:hypothetical protein